MSDIDHTQAVCSRIPNKTEDIHLSLKEVVFDRMLKRMQQKVHTRQYIMTLRAEGEMDAEQITIFDLEHCLLSGVITEQRKDKATGD